MSLTFAELQSNPDIMRDMYNSVFTDEYSDEELAALKITVARDRLKRDSCRIFRLDTSESADMAVLDELAAGYAEAFARALVYLQCYYYFSDCDDTDGVNAKRMKECMAAYREELAGFGSFLAGGRTTTAMAVVSRG